MALIKCPECSAEISDKAISCPHCGFPIDKQILAIDKAKINIEPPSLPDDLSIGKNLTNWNSDVAINCEYENNGLKDDWIESGPKVLLLHERGLQVAHLPFSPNILEINYTQIISVEEIKVDELQKNKSVLGRAAVGLVVLGPLGAIIGGMSGLQQGMINKFLLIIVYWDPSSKSPNTFSAITNYSSQPFINRLLTERAKLLSQFGIADQMPPSVSEKEIINFIKRNLPEKANQTDEELLRKVRESKKNGACFVATVVYNDANCIEVQKLRAWRDEKLKASFWGRIFIFIYYKVGEKLSLFVKPRPNIKLFVRKLLDSLVKRI